MDDSIQLNKLVDEQFDAKGKSEIEEVFSKRCIIDHQQFICLFLHLQTQIWQVVMI